MAALVPDPSSGLLVLAPEDQFPVDITTLPSLGAWTGTVTRQPPPAPGLTLALGEEVVLVVGTAEYRAVVVATVPTDGGDVHYTLRLKGLAGAE